MKLKYDLNRYKHQDFFILIYSNHSNMKSSLNFILVTGISFLNRVLQLIIKAIVSVMKSTQSSLIWLQSITDHGSTANYNKFKGKE